VNIKTTHVGSLPRPSEMVARNLKNEVISRDDLRAYLSQIIERQMALGITYINNGELPRMDYVRSTIQRLSGFFDTGIAPFPHDLEDLPEFSRRFGGRNGLITLNPKAPVKLPACSEKLAYTGEASLREELEMMIGVFNELKQKLPATDAELFFTAPSPGTVALFLENKYYPDYQHYIESIGAVLQQEYEIIDSYGIHLQIDCPDLAMGRHTKFKHLEDREFLEIIECNIAVLNRALFKINQDRIRAHICWGNYSGTHHRDMELDKIFNHVMAINAKYISLESSNHRHAHEWELFNVFHFPDDKTLMPGLIDTTSNTVEHPKLVAHRISNFVKILGPDRVIGSTDCGFASTASATSVSGEIAWLKLKSLVDGAKLASGQLA
jgi:5-methyltetrahydropteroyltriglutamate--homocysteine methyltransferase